jgi:hypothetical protein
MEKQFNLLFIAVLVATFYAGTACTTVAQLILILTLSFVGLVGSLMIRDLSINSK